MKQKATNSKPTTTSKPEDSKKTQSPPISPFLATLIPKSNAVINANFTK